MVSTEVGLPAIGSLEPHTAREFEVLGSQRHVVWYKSADVSEERISSVFTVEE